MTAVVEEDVGQVSGLLVDASWFSLKSPLASGSPDTIAYLEAATTVPFHVVDQLFRTDVVADQVLVAGEKDDGDLGEEVGEELDAGF